MGKFNSVACYSAIKELRNEDCDIITAYARLIAHMLYEKSRKKSFDLNKLINTIKDEYSLEIPYHPLQTILKKCKSLGYVSIINGKIVLNKEYADDEYDSIYKNKIAQFKELLNEYIDFLSNEYNEYISEQTAYEQIEIFLENSDLTFINDKNRIYDQHQYRLAKFLIKCIEEKNNKYIDIVNDYIVGASLTQLLLFQEKPDDFIFKDLSIYIDAPIIFRLLGIDSLNRKQIYINLIKQMQVNGIKVKAYDHTINEVIGIIEDSKYWIGNIEFDSSLANETSKYFVENNWSKADIDELSINVQRKLENNLNISIDKMPYPNASDINTISESEIKSMIKQEYQINTSNENIETKEYTIDLDAKSLFLTMHKSKGIVAHNINNLRVMFLTTNKALAKIGRKMSKECLHGGDTFFPIAMDDVRWGTILWFDTPDTMSNFSRDKLISAAYAAFRPSSTLIRKFNTTLIDALKNNQITNEECYLMRTKPEIATILLEITKNDDEYCIDITPLEVINRIRAEGYNKAISEKNEEIENLKQEKNETITHLTSKNIEIENRCRLEGIRADIAEKSYIIKENKIKIQDIKDNITEIDKQIQNEKAKEEKSKKLAKKVFLAIIFIIWFGMTFLMKKLVNIYLTKKDYVDYIWLGVSFMAVLFPWVTRLLNISETKIYEHILKKIKKYTDRYYKINLTIIDTLNVSKSTKTQEKEQLEIEIQELQNDINELENNRQLITI